MVKDFPSTCQFDGFDYSPAAFPPKDQLPSNVTLNVADAKQPFAEEFRGKYDVVCIRFINAAMKPEDWVVVARNAAQMLKPGGALQWVWILSLNTTFLLINSTNDTRLKATSLNS
jgi:hypothetical protein